jgi:anti-anti-sigma factor
MSIPFSSAATDSAASATDAADDDLVVDTYAHDGVPFVAARGDVDLSTAPTLRTALERNCEERRERGPLGVDIRDVGFIDSAGLALLVEVRKRFLDTCQLALVITPGSQPERVLKLGRFDTFLTVCYSPEEVTGATSSSSGGASHERTEA